MSAKRHSKKNKKSSVISANQQNLHEHRKFIPNLKFKQVPIIEIEVDQITTDNFIDKVSEFTKLPKCVESGGFMILRPKKNEKHRYLIDPSKMPKNWHYSLHSDQHYFINQQRTNSFNNKPCNKEWAYDIPQLSKKVNNKPLLVGSYPQKTCDVITPLFTPQSPLNQTQQENNTDNSNNNDSKNNTDNQRKRKRNQTQTPTHHNTLNTNSKRRKVRHGNNHNHNNKVIKLPKELRVPFGDNLFDLRHHLSRNDIHQFTTSATRSHPAHRTNRRNSNKHNHNHKKTETLSLFNQDNDNDIMVLSTNIDSIEMHHDKAFDIELFDTIFSKKTTAPPITITDMAIDNKHNHNHTILALPSLDTPTPPLTDNDNDNNSESETNSDMQLYRGFAFVVNQFAEKTTTISNFWRPDAFEDTLLSSPYDGASAEQIPLIFAHDLLTNNKETERFYGIIGGDITVYDESSPLDLVNLSLHGPFAEFTEGGADNEYMEGVQSPYIYLGNTSTWFAWHREDMNLYAVNHLLWGKAKLWYCIPPAYTAQVLQYVRIQYKDYCGDLVNACNENEACWTPLQHKQFWFDPYVLLSMGIPVYFFRQQPGDIMVTSPGGLHAGLNTGPNMAQSLNFMTHDAFCWRTCLSAMHFALFNNCVRCLGSVWIDFHELAERCRRSEKCEGRNKRFAPSLRLVPRVNGEEIYEHKVRNVCVSLTDGQRRKKREVDPVNISQSVGERLWVYPVRRSDSKYWYPAVWIETCYAWDSLQFELLYKFKYLDSGTVRGRNSCEHFVCEEVLWDKGLLILDWNRQQRFKPLTERDKRRYPMVKKYLYPRRQGNMLLNYGNIVRRDYVDMYYQKSGYYVEFEEEAKYKDLYRKNWKSVGFRSKQQMINDIDKQHVYFLKIVENKKDYGGDDVE